MMFNYLFIDTNGLLFVDTPVQEAKLAMGNIASATVFFVLSVVCFYLWRRTVRRIQNRETIVPPRAIIPTPFGLLDVSIMFMAWVLGQLAVMEFATWWLQFEPTTVATLKPTARAMFTSIVATGQLLSTAVGMLLIWLRYRVWEIFGWRPAYFRKDLLLGLMGFAMVVPLILLLQQALTVYVEYHHPTIEMLNDANSWPLIQSAWLAAVLVAPICEEIFFRGVLQAWLQRLVSASAEKLDRTINGGWENNAAPTIKVFSFLPILISATIFSLVHIGQGPAPIPLFFLGLALGYLYQQTGSILPCIILHLGLNAFTMTWVTAQVFLM